MKTAPLSKVQYGIYAECIAHQGEICYNLPYLFVLDGSLDEEKLKNAIELAKTGELKKEHTEKKPAEDKQE